MKTFFPHLLRLWKRKNLSLLTWSFNIDIQAVHVYVCLRGSECDVRGFVMLQGPLSPVHSSIHSDRKQWLILHLWGWTGPFRLIIIKGICYCHLQGCGGTVSYPRFFRKMILLWPMMGRTAIHQPSIMWFLNAPERKWRIEKEGLT